LIDGYTGRAKPRDPEALTKKKGYESQLRLFPRKRRESLTKRRQVYEDVGSEIIARARYSFGHGTGYFYRVFNHGGRSE
jgi:hypothetical protein